MVWQEFIHADPEVLRGKPVIKGTRLSVEFLLGLMGAGWTEEQVLAQYPLLTHEQMQAVFQYAATLAQEERFYMLPPA